MPSGGRLGVYTLFLMTGGMSLPYIFGLIFWNEPFSVLRTAGILLITAGVICANISKKRSSDSRGGLYLLLGVIVFVLNGCASIISKSHQIDTAHATVSAASFVMLVGLMRAVTCAAAFAVCAKKDPAAAKELPLLHAVPITAASAVISGASYLFQLIGAANLPATVLSHRDRRQHRIHNAGGLAAVPRKASRTDLDRRTALSCRNAAFPVSCP